MKQAERRTIIDGSLGIHGVDSKCRADCQSALRIYRAYPAKSQRANSFYAVADAPDAAVDVVADVEGAVGADDEAEEPGVGPLNEPVDFCGLGVAAGRDLDAADAAIKKVTIIQELSRIPETNLDMVKAYLESLLAKIQVPSPKNKSLNGIWKGAGFENLPNLAEEIRTARQELQHTILTRNI